MTFKLGLYLGLFIGIHAFMLWYVNTQEATMQRHYCMEERCWLDFEQICSWCGITEQQAQEHNKGTSDDKFRAIMERIRANANPEITDD